MEQIQLEKDWSVFMHEDNARIPIPSTTVQLRPTELHMIPNGDMDDNPSYAIMLVDLQGSEYVAQISERMLMSGINMLNDLKTK